MAEEGAGGRGARVLRLQRIVQRPDRRREVQDRPRRVPEASALPGFLGQGRAARRAVLAGRQREAPGPQLPGPGRQQRQPGDLRRGHRRGGAGERRAVRGPLRPVPLVVSGRRETGAFPDGERLSADRGGEQGARAVPLQGALRRGRAIQGLREAPRLDQREELGVAFAVPDRRRLQRVRRPFGAGVPAGQRRVRLRPERSGTLCLQLQDDAAGDGGARHDDGEPRQARVGRGEGRRHRDRRQQPAEGRTGRDEQAGRERGRFLQVHRRRGVHLEDDGPLRHEGVALRERGAVPRAGQPLADGMGHQGPALGGGLAELS